ncbi:MAG: FUSC family protein [Candidatus Sulfotelmatobacter sp.]|jgi:uncharacterized membrane protein YccC
MGSSNPPLPLPAIPALSPAPSFWSRESAAIKLGIKTGLAGLITYAIYIGWNLPQGYWAVFTALVVAQVTQGASWKPALYRTIGSTVGALAAMLMMMIFGTGSVRVGIVLFVLASLFGFLTVHHPSFSVAGFTVGIVVTLGSIEGSPIHIGWLRVLYTLLGSFVAFAVGALVWPVHARVGLRSKLANILQGSGALYGAIVAAALEGASNEEEIRRLDHELHDLRRGITQQLDEARSELRFARFNVAAFQAVIERSDQMRRRLTAMAEDCSLYVQAKVQPSSLPSLPMLVECTTRAFNEISQAVRSPNTTLRVLPELDQAVRQLESDLARLRKERVTSPFTLDRMLPFWSFVFNLRELAQDLQSLAASMGELN